MLPDGEKICQNLRGVEFVGQAVPHGHTGVGSQSFHDLLAKTTVFDAVIHPTQHTGGVSNGLLLTQLGAAGIQIGGMHSEIGGGHLECTTGAGGGFFEDQGDGFTLAEPMGDAGLFLGLQISGEVKKVLDFRRGEVQQLEKMFVFHGALLTEPWKGRF